MSTTETQLVEILQQFLANQQEILDTARKGGVQPAFLSLAEAEKYCGFYNAQQPDSQHRRFKRFLAAEGVQGKRGQTKSSLFFSRSELDRVMTSRLVHVRAAS